MLGIKSRSTTIESPKSEVGEIDTRAPFESVKAAVSLFGEVAFSGDRSSSRRSKSFSNEKALATETKLHLAQKEINKFKEQLHNAEDKRVQALAELEKAKAEVDDLTIQIRSINESKEQALLAAEAAKSQANQLEESRPDGCTEKDNALKHELDGARKQYATALSELDAAKQELRRIRKEFEASVDAKATAIKQEIQAKQLSDANKKKATQLSRDIAAAHESLVQVKLATEKAKQEESRIISENRSKKKFFMVALEETETRLASLKKDFDPQLQGILKRKLEETEAAIGCLQKQIKYAKASDPELIVMLNTEMDGAIKVLTKVEEEKKFLLNEVESLKLQLEDVKMEHSKLKENITDIECKANPCSEIATECDAPHKEVEKLKRKADDQRSEADEARLAFADAEGKLQIALRELEEAKAAEARATQQFKELSKKANESRSSISESGAKVTISRAEYESLRRKVEDVEKLTNMKLAAAMAKAEAVRASENEAIKRLEAAQKEMKDIEATTEHALKRTEMAEEAKKAVEGELKRWRDQQKQDENIGQGMEKSDRKMNKTPSRKALLPVLSGIFHRKKSLLDGSRSPSELANDKNDKYV